MGIRILSGIGGAVVLLVGALFTLGIALVAPLGMLAARLWARRQGRPTTRMASWIGACIASSLVVLVGGGAFYWSLAPGEFARLTTISDSARTAARAHPPGWVESMRRVAPPNAAADQLINSRPFTTATTILGIFLAVEMLGIVGGSVGWVGTRLILHALQRPRPGPADLRSS